MECEFCKRVYFDSNPGNHERGRLEELKKLERNEPKKYIALDGDAHWGTINGKQYVVECSCNGAREYEEFIWAHRNLIADYLVARADKQLKQAQQDSRLAKEVSKSVNSLG